jgi:hypothetical protein
MKIVRILACLALLAGFAIGQNGPPPSVPQTGTNLLWMPLYTLNTSPVSGASLAIAGPSGQATYCYWAVANFQVGSAVSSLGCVPNGPNTLSGGNYISIAPFNYPPGTTGVDILENASATQAPAGVCNCAVATGLTSGNVHQISNTLSSYTVPVFNPENYGLTLSNEVVSAGVSHWILRQGWPYPGTEIADLSVSSGGVTGPTSNGGLALTGSTLGLLKTCSSGQVLSYNGTAWVCAAASSGSVTGATTNGGLVLSGSTLGLLATCANQQVLEWNGTAWVCITPSDVASGVVRVTPVYNFTACALTCPIVTTGAATLIAGSNTVTLTPCPLGVNGTDSPHYLSLAPGAGDPTPEWFLITGGTCTSGAASGTITFTAAYSHLANYVIGSATSGIQEAYYTVTPPGISIALIPGTNYTVAAPLYVRGGASLLNGNYATLTHASFNSAVNIGAGTSFGATGAGEGYELKNLVMVAGTAPWSVVFTGSVSGSSPTATLTLPTCPAAFYANIPGQLLWLAGTASGLPTTVYGYGEYVVTTGGGSTCLPGVTNGTVNIAQATPGVTNLSPHDHGSSLSNGVSPWFEDAASQGTHIHDIKWLSPTPITTLVGGNSIQINNDQSAAIDNIDMQAGFGWRNDADFQSAGVFGPGPYSIDAGILSYGPNVNVGSTGIGSCVRWYNGNDFSTTGQNVCQAFSTGGITVGLKRGGFGQFAIGAGIHFENSGVASPWGVPLGNPSLMVIGGVNKPLINNTITFGTGIGFSTNGDAPYPQFQPTPAAQTTIQEYYLVAHQNTQTGCTSGGDCLTIPTLIGGAFVNDPSANNVSVAWYGWGAGTYGATNYMPVATYDLLRVSYAAAGSSLAQPPTGTGNYLVASGINPATVCSIHNVCTVTDNVAPGSLASYTVQSAQTNSKNFYPLVQLLPGVVSLTGSGRAGTPFTATAGSMLYRGTPTCINSMEYLGPSMVASFLGMSLGSEADVGFDCPNQYAPIQTEGYGLTCWKGANPALCSTAKRGTVEIAVSATTVTVDSSAVQPFTRIQITEDASQGTNLGTTCNTTAGRTYAVSSVVYGVSFTITASAAPATNPACLDFEIQ